MDWTSCLEDSGSGDKIPTLNCVPLVAHNLLTYALYFAGFVALVMIILSGIKMINSGGDAKQVQGARTTLTFAIIGLTVIFFSLFILNLIAYITGAHCITTIGFTQCQ